MSCSSCAYRARLAGPSAAPCSCGGAQLASLADWFQDTDAVPDFGGTDRAAVAAYLVRAKWTHAVRGAMFGFLAGGITAGLLLSLWGSGIRRKVTDRVTDAALDRYIPRGGRR